MLYPMKQIYTHYQRPPDKGYHPYNQFSLPTVAYSATAHQHLHTCSSNMQLLLLEHQRHFLYIICRAVSTGQVGRYLPDHFLEHQPLAARTSQLRLDDLDWWSSEIWWSSTTLISREGSIDERNQVSYSLSGERWLIGVVWQRKWAWPKIFARVTLIHTSLLRNSWLRPCKVIIIASCVVGLCSKWLWESITNQLQLMH